MNGKVTITDVAKTADVSISTVSNLLNGRSKRMRPETEARIRTAIKQLGYKPNQAARQLKTGQARIIGMIVPSVANPFYGVFAHHVEKTALKHGYQLLLCNSERDPEREERYANELWGYGVRGIIFGSALMRYNHIDDLMLSGLKVVAFNRLSGGQNYQSVDSIGVDNVLAARLAIKHLLSLGHRRIGVLSGAITTVSRINRLEGYKAALHEAGIEVNPDYIWQGPQDGSLGDANAVELGRHGAHELLSIADRPTALFTINDMNALGAYAGARDLGLEVPKDVSIVGMDDIVLAEIAHPPLTTIRQPIQQIAEMATERLIGRVEESITDDYEHVILTPRLIVRDSTAPIHIEAN